MINKIIARFFDTIEGIIITVWAIKTFGWKGYRNIRSISKPFRKVKW